MRIVPVETWTTNRRRATIAVIIAVVLGICAGALLGKARAIAWGFGLTLFMALRFSKQEENVPIQVRPNQSIEFSLHEARKYCIRITLACVVVFTLSYGHFEGYLQGFINGVHALTFSFTFFFFGGIPVLKHYAMRFVLRRAKLLPWEAVPFLTTAVRTGLMRQMGGAFQFSHPDFQDYFAERAGSETWGLTNDEHNMLRLDH